MNDLLLSEISSQEKSLLSALTLIEEHIFEQSDSYECALASIIESCQDSVDGIDTAMAQAECLINTLYVDELFIDNFRPLWPVLSHQMASAVTHRTMAPVLKAALIQHIVNACDLEAELVYVPEKVMVRIICDDLYSIIFDPISGESLNWQDLDSRLDGLTDDPSQLYLEPMEMQSILIEHLSALKTALINEQQFDCALKCVDLLLSLRPGDPFERRDRGFLLHQLDCFKVAYDDYQYFVDQCPKDPAAQLLKLQLDQIKIADTVIH